MKKIDLEKLANENPVRIWANRQELKGYSENAVVWYEYIPIEGLNDIDTYLVPTGRCAYTEPTNAKPTLPANPRILTPKTHRYQIN